jgi:uncharacterized OsmC-like protein
MNVLENMGKPLFFKAGLASGLAPPANRRGIGVRVAARSLSVMQKEALVASSLGGQTWRVSSDEGAYLDGDDAAPCPLAHMTAGMVASFMETTLRLARQREIELPHFRLIQDNYYTMKGSALKGTMTGGALPVGLTAEIDSSTSREQVESLMQDAVAQAPVRGLMSAILKSRFTLTHNGNPVEPGEVQTVDGSAIPLNGDLFDSAQPAEGDWSGLMQRNGMSPTTDEITSSSGSSYAAEQSRQLHVRGICSLRPDGMKVIEQQLFNPHGSIFYLLSEEGEAAGGKGRAPDAMSYVSAGLAFCFLTQFGRYAKIVKKPLKEYAVVQDTYFSTLTPGESASAEPVETHVHLATDQDDEFARKALGMSEQTCFLHALCRSEIGVNLEVVGRS